MKNSKKLIFGILVVSFSLLLSFNVSAITAKIGNGKMILNVEVGDTVEKSIWVINDNDVAVDITLIPSGDLERDVEVLENNFRLEPMEDKSARFKIPITEAGRTETRINVKFTPVDGTQEVGLASLIIINAGEVGSLSDDENDDVEGSSLLTGNIIGANGVNKTYLVLGLSTLLLGIALVVLLYYSKKIRKKKVNKGDSKRIKKEVEVK